MTFAPEAPARKGERARPAAVRFAPASPFQRELKARVEKYFVDHNLSPQDHPRMVSKTITILIWLVSSYCAMVFIPMPWWGRMLAALSLGMAMAGVGFSIQHDGNHQAYSANSRVNRWMALSMDFIGASSYIWNYKHNILHHTYANITGHDDDIEMGILGRLSPHQPKLKFHRFQHIYLWFLYGFITPKWHLFDDFKNLYIARIGDHPFPRPKGRDLVNFIVGKTLFLTLAFVVPSFFMPVWAAIGLYFFANFAQGILLSVVFQLAHAVEGAEFPMPDAETNRIGSDWMTHQLLTTVDFARDSRFLTWYLGGLNFQVEHHLFPRVCHIHYPEISKIVEQTCKEYGAVYNAQPTFAAGIGAHYRWLKHLAKSEPVTA